MTPTVTIVLAVASLLAGVGLGLLLAPVLIGRQLLPKRRAALALRAQQAGSELFGLGTLVVSGASHFVITASSSAREQLGLLELPRRSRMPQVLPAVGLVRLLAERGRKKGIFTLQRAPGDQRSYEARITEIEDPAAGPHARVVALRDVTEEEENTVRLRRLAYYDNLTGLANRRRFFEVLNTAVVLARRRKNLLAVLYFDLDRFKEINDSLGHAAGDQLLRVVAQRLRQDVRAGVLDAGSPDCRAEIARLGGDEFAIVLSNVGSAEYVGKVATHLLGVVRDPVWLQDRDVTNSASIGVAVFPRDASDAEELLRNADAALYEAKEAGRNRIAFFETSLAERAAREAKIKRLLGEGVGAEEFELHYQPKVDLKTGELAGAEALLRWTSAELGSVSPGEFIPVAESAGLAPIIGSWVIDRACRRSGISGNTSR